MKIALVGSSGSHLTHLYLLKSLVNMLLQDLNLQHMQNTISKIALFQIYLQKGKIIFNWSKNLIFA